MNEEKNHNLIFVFSVIFLLIILGGLFYYFNNSLMRKINNKTQSSDDIGQDISGEVENIKQINKDIINSVSKERIGNVKKISEGDYILGDIGAPIQLIVYDDMDSDFSVDYDDSLREASDYFGEKVVIAFRNFPMRSHSDSLVKAMAAECAGEQGKFLEMRDFILRGEYLDISDDIFLESLENFDSNEFKSCLEENRYLEKIQSDIDEATALSVIGAPTTFLNDKVLPGAYQFEDFVDSANIERQGLKSIIEKELE